MNLKRTVLLCFILFGALSAKCQTLTVSPNQTANFLATRLIGKGIILPGTGLSLNCNTQSNGTFINVNPTPNLSLAIDTGIVLCTGRVLTVAGDTGINADRLAQASKNWGNTITDAQITSIAPAGAIQRDLCFLQFHFVPQGDTAFIDYVFASEEYPEYGCSQYVDAFGIFVAPPSSSTFTNYAKVPGTNVNVSTNSINDTMKQTGWANYVNYCQSLGSGAPFIQYYTGNLINNHIVYDGMTKVLRAAIPVSPFQTHTMKIAIADIADGFFDSGIFLKQFSFNSKIKLEIAEKRGTNGIPVVDTVNLIEGCNQGFVKFTRLAITSPITVNVNFSGTASSNDYAASSSFTIPAGSSNFNYGIQAILDTMKELPETLRVVFSVPSINYSDTVLIVIKDFAHGVNIFSGKRDTAICSGRTLPISFSSSSTDYTFAWSPAARLSCTNCLSTIYTAPVVTAFTNDTVKLRISTGGCTPADTNIVVRVQPFPVLSLNPSIAYCKGDSAQIVVSPNPVGSYTYAWSPATALSSTTIPNPIAKPTNSQSYKVLVSTSAGCKDSISTTVKISEVRDEVDSVVVTKTSCGLSNGGIRIRIKSGAIANPPYQFSINGGATFVSMNTFNGLAVGTYNVAIRNVAGCRFDTTVTITAGSSAPSATFKIDSTTCGLNNGKVKILVKSGIKPLTQTWRLDTTVISSDTFIDNRSAGVYTLSIQDSLGCFVQYTIPIGPSSPSSSALAVIHPTCGLANGAITITPSSGIAPYKYLWSIGDTVGMIVGKASGTYIHTLTDAKGCIKRDTIVLNNSSGIQVSKSSSLSNCGLPSGSATISIVSGGTAPYIYAWSNGVSTSAISSTSHSISGLSKGRYRVTIQDGGGCVKIDSIFVDGTPRVSLNFIKTNTNCGLANGSITVQVIAGKSPYTYQWSGGASTATRTGLIAGSYLVTVTDVNGCTAASNVVLTNNSLPTITTKITRPTCGLNNGRIIATVAGGKPKIKYNWSHGDSTSSVAKLTPGIYTLTITDSFGCTAIKKDTLTAIPKINFSDSVIQPNCRNSLGSIVLKNITGPAPITILWNNGTSDTSLVNKSTGVYSVMLRDSNNCRLSKIYKLTSKSNPQIKFEVTNAICSSTVGSIITTVDSASLPISYSWSSGDTSKNLLNKPKGYYTLVVTDSFGCKDTLSDSIRRRPSPTYSDSFKTPRCGLNNGLIHIYNISGFGPFSFSWSHSATAKTGLVNSLAPNVYIVSISDVNGCQLKDTFNLNSNGNISVVTSTTRSKCKDSTGKVSLTILGGTPPYNITWSNGDKGSSADSLKYGFVGLHIRDSLGCVYTDSIKVNDSTNTKVNFQITKTRCDRNSGKVTASPFGGYSPYRYIWDRFPSDTFASIDSLGAKLYGLKVIDSLGCVYDTAVSVKYTHYPEIKDSVVAETCNGGNGEVHIKIDSVIYPITIRWNGINDSVYKKTGIRGPLTYTVSVIDSHKCNASKVIQFPENPTQFPRLVSVPPPCGRDLGSLEVVGDIVNTYTWSFGGKTTKKIDSLAPGPYAVTASGTNGCIFILRDTLKYTQPPSTSHLIDRPNCGKYDGAIHGSATSKVGNLEYVYRKIPASFSSYTPMEGNFDIENIDSGDYVVQIRDAYGCMTTDTLHIKDSAAQKLQLQTTNARCTDDNGKVKAVILGGKRPYTIQWYDFTGLDSVVNLSSGIYHITVTDDRNCVVNDSAEIKFFLPPELSLQGENSLCGNGKGKVTSTVGFGVMPFTYQWQSSSVTTKDRINLNGGTYRLTVTDSLGCKDTASVVISAQPALVANLSKTSAHCDLDNGTASANIVSGTLPYNIMWNGSSMGLNLTGIDSGKHIFHVIDANNCEYWDSIFVPRIPRLNLSTSIVNDNCTYKIGGILATASSGKLPYTYAWSHNATLSTNVANGLGMGNYTVSVTDSLGCQVSELCSISDSAGPAVALVITNASCGLNNASVLANVSTNKPPISYYWNNVLGTNSLTNINGGRYICRVVDARGCVKIDTAVLDTVFALTGSLQKKNASCNFNNGYVKVNAIGGTGTKTYTWGHTWQQLDSISNLSPGTYRVSVADTKGCMWKDSITIVQQGNPILTLTKYDAICRQPNGRIKVNLANQASPMNYSWSHTFFSDSAYGLTPGNYRVTVSDGFGCNINANTNVGNIGMDSIQFSIFHPRCTVNNGRVKAIAVNAVGTKTFLWSTSSTLDSIHPLAPGSYTVTVSDSLCSYTKTANLVMGTIPQIILSKIDATCGLNNGIINSMVINGTPPMSYLWSNGMTPANIFGADSGNYKVVVTDNYGCKDSSAIHVGRVSGLTINFTTTKSKCGLANGSIQATVSGGAPNYDYTWNTGAKTSALSNVLAGKYWLSVRDQNNCIQTDTIVVEDRKKPLIIENKIQAVCGKANGAIMITIQDGTQPFTYAWNTGKTTKNLDSLAVGIYNLTVTDSLGCTTSKSIDIDPGTPPYLHIDSTRSEQSTCGLKNGKMQALLMRGVDPITYTWSTGDTGRRVQNILPGKHYLTVVDGRQCVVFDSLVVSTTTIPKIKLDTTDAYCLRATGQITSTVTDGSPPFVYQWSHGASTPNAVNVNSGNYTLTVIDRYNCANSARTAVKEEINLVRSSYDTFGLKCFNDFSGKAILHATGGRSPYTYTIVTSSTDSVFNGLGAGKYYFSVMDNKGCIYNDSLLVTQPDSIHLQFDSIKPLTCYNRNDGMLQASAKGGNGGYSYIWLPSNQIGNRATALGEGAYKVRVTDVKGCFNVLSHEFINPAEIVIKSKVIDNKCFGEAKGSIQLETKNGVPPYTYSWSNGNATNNPTQLSNGNYRLTLTDKVGCVVTYLDSVRSPKQIDPGQLKSVDIACREQLFGEIEIVNYAGGTDPFVFSLNNKNQYSLRPKFNDLLAGKYKVYIRDFNGCEDSLETVINSFPPFSISAYPQDTTVALGESVQLGFDIPVGNPTLINQITWSKSEGLNCTDCRSPLATTYVNQVYAVEVQYNNQCFVYDTVQIKIIDTNDLYIPNSFAPSASNAENRTFRIYANRVIKAELMIFNRWGEKMYETDEANLIGWNGVYKGEPAPMDVYVYYVRVTYFSGRKVERKGDVTLVR